MPYPKQSIELQADAEAFAGRHGVIILARCTPYQVGTLPTFGEHCAWMESSAVVYANSVLGARTNCEGGASTGAASLTGRIPCWGKPPRQPRRRRGHPPRGGPGAAGRRAARALAAALRALRGA